MGFYGWDTNVVLGPSLRARSSSEEVPCVLAVQRSVDLMLLGFKKLNDWWQECGKLGKGRSDRRNK